MVRNTERLAGWTVPLRCHRARSVSRLADGTVGQVRGCRIGAPAACNMRERTGGQRFPARCGRPEKGVLAEWLEQAVALAPAEDDLRLLVRTARHAAHFPGTSSDPRCRLTCRRTAGCFLPLPSTLRHGSGTNDRSRRARHNRASVVKPFPASMRASSQSSG